MKNIIIAFVALLVILTGAVLLFLDNNAQDSTSMIEPTTAQFESAPSVTLDNAQQSNLPYIGNPENGVKIIEFVDYKCPNCNRFHRNVGEELKTTYVDSGQAFIEVRQLPFIGPDSRRAANGAYCAAAADIFPAYNDAVFNYIWDNFYEDGNFQAEFEDILTTDKLVELVASNLEDQDSFRTCIDTAVYDTSVESDLNLAQESGVRGTPSFIIGGKTLSNQQPLSVFESLIKLEQ